MNWAFVCPVIEDQVSSSFFFSHCTESKFPLLVTSNTTFDVPDSLIQEPNFDADKSRFNVGFEAKPEKKLPDVAAPSWLKYETYNSLLELTETLPPSPLTL